MMLLSYGKLSSIVCTNISRNELCVFSIALLLFFFFFFPQAHYFTEMLFYFGLSMPGRVVRALVREHFSLFLVGR